MRWRPQADIQVIESRARMLQDIRAFFAARDVLEIETPILSQAAVTDVHLDTMSAKNLQQQVYLNTSPEYCMKRFIAEYQRSVYQISKCFREGEQGPYHNPEFTMLEWYRINFSLRQLMQEVETLLLQLLAPKTDRNLNVVYISYQALFMQETGINPHAAQIQDYYEFVQQQNIEIPVGISTTQADGLQGEIDKNIWLDWLMSDVICTGFPAQQMTFIYDYPASQAALAQIALNEQGEKIARRFECYIGPVELANGYQELTDSEQQQQRFVQDNKVRECLARPAIQYDDRLLQALAAGLPECAGVALGLDRLLMRMCACDDIADCLSFPWQRA